MFFGFGERYLLAYEMKKKIKKEVKCLIDLVSESLFGRHLPSRFVIGAQKSGTTALYHYFSQHPQVLRTAIKELNFFHSDVEYAQGLSHYAKYFSPKKPFNKDKVVIDVSPGYLLHAERAASRIYQFNADARLVAIFRNPVERSFSGWNMYRKFHQQDKDWFFKHRARLHTSKFDRDTVKRPRFGESFYDDVMFEMDLYHQGKKVEMPLLEHGFYAAQLSYYYDLFKNENILLVLNEDLSKNTVITLSKIEQHWGLTPATWEALDTNPIFKGGYSSKVDDKSRAVLQEFYRPFNQSFKELSGLDIDW